MISIIIPIYNVDSYLRICLESILEQDYSEFEVILVDDGSTDASGSICKEFVERDSRFYYYYQENSGVSVARNYGLENSKGKWIVFIDPDDYILKNHLSLLIEKSAGSQLICGGYIYKNSNSMINRWFDNYTCISSSDASEFMINDMRFYSFLWNKLFCASTLLDNDIIFDSNISYGEDLLFLFNYLECIQYVTIIPKTGYVYVRHEDSVGGKLTEEKVLRKLTYISALMEIESRSTSNPKLRKDITKKIAIIGTIYRANMIQLNFEKIIIKDFTNKIIPYIKKTLFQIGTYKERIRIILRYAFPKLLKKYI